MRFAYADPPYVGCAGLYPEKTEVDHGALFARLRDEFPDGWALSASSPSLPYLLGLPDCPADIRIAAWVKPFAVFKPNVNPAYTWEPVIFMGGRRGDRSRSTVKDHLSESITLRKGLVGAKPRRFCFWIFDLLGMEPGDELVDLYLGTGIVSACWNEFCGRERPVQEGMLA